MNKRTILVLALVLALALPAAAFAASPGATTANMEFTLGGFIKLQTFWDSTQEGKNMNTLIVRNNVVNGHHGRTKFTAQGSRFNFTIKGPKLWGATTTGYIEIDFDSAEAGVGGAANSASASYTPRLRHAFFRLNWPETELLLGQYFSFFSRWYPELLQDGPFQITGTPTARLAQIRLTQKFAGAFTVAALVGEANGITNGEVYSGNDRLGAESTECPQIQVKAEYSKDLYGKAAWYGKPTPFTAEVVFGWQRGIIQDGGRALSATGQNNYAAIAGFSRHTYLNPWVAAANFFIPVIPTHSANLAGTASLQTSWWIGQGAEAFGWTSFNSQVFRWTGQDAAGLQYYDVDLMSRFGGQISAQYYFTNQWFMTAAWGMSRAFSVGAFQTDANNPVNRKAAFFGDAADYHHEFDLNLWYRPITAVKLAIGYAYARTNYFQNVQTNSWKTNLGEAHRVQGAAIFYF